MAHRASGRGALRAWATHHLADRALEVVTRTLGPDAAVMPLKGALLARVAYHDPSERPMVDLDLLAVRPGLLRTLGALRARGFSVEGWSGDLHVTLTVPGVAGMRLDLHGRPLPRGYGAVDTPWLVHGAHRVPGPPGAAVLRPDLRRAFVHLVGCALRDLLVRAPPHCREDLQRTFEALQRPPEELARVLAQARLQRACWAVLEHFGQGGALAALEPLKALLRPRGLALSRAKAILGALQRHGVGEAPALWVGALPLALADDPRDALLGVLALGVSLPLGWASGRLYRVEAPGRE
ncbi:MAG: nucleotidyltransferase family protein [Deltaproteobacteria bacterium]|nr:nucleotidyltransferase family protein [Deltaproteobacteria bacterium]